MLRQTRLALILAALISAGGPLAAEEFRDVEAFWTLLHEPAAVEELKLSEAQQEEFRTLLDDLDLRFFPLRNKPREEAEAGSVKLVGEARQKLKTLLQPKQSQRLKQMTWWRLGVASIVQDEVAAKLGCTKAQRLRLEDALGEMQKAAADIEKQVQAGEPREPLEQKYKDLQVSGQKKLLQTLKPEQQSAWKELLGPQFELSRLGQPRYKVPELVDTDGWINSRGEQLGRLRGKVIVVHFYACGCINCIHNYPWYREWQEKFAGEDFALLGIHSPETDAERDLEHVRKKAAEEKLTFPILLDGQSQNWANWGNSMWPSVYVIDKRGYLRHFWPGELKWLGTDGEKFLRERIEKLLEEH